MHRPTLLVLATALALAACSSDKPKTDAAGASDQPAAASSSASSSSGDQDLADVTNYKLTMDKVDKLFAAQRNLALKVKGMSPAERAAFDSTDISDANADLAATAARIDRLPPMRDAIREAGLSSREYITATMAMVQAGMAASVLKMRPKDNQDSLIREMKASKDNIRFMQEHEAELNRKQQAMQAEMQKMGLGEKGSEGE